MKRTLVKLSALLSFLAMVVLPTQVGATDRILATFNTGDLYVKEGPASSGWQQITGGVSSYTYSAAGNRISLLDESNPQTFVNIKEPAWNSPWNPTYWTDGSTPQAIAQYSAQLSDGTYRLVVDLSDGTIIMKDGAWNAAWWSGTLALPPGNVSETVVGGDRVGVVMDTGNFYVKQLTPGQFSNPNNVPWTLEATNVVDAKMTNTRIAYEDASSNDIYAKDGSINAPWYGNHAIIYDGMAHSAAYYIGGDRICVVKVTHEECKEGDLGTQSILLWNTPGSIDVSSDRIVLRNNADGQWYLMEGSLNGPNSGWEWIGGNNMTALTLNQ